MAPHPATVERIQRHVAQLPPGPLTEERVHAHLAPLFSRTLMRNASRVYLANHSLGRPLDAMDEDVREALAMWYERQGDAWEPWSDELSGHRERLAVLLGARRSDSIVPKTSAGQGLRAVLNSYDRVPRVVATRGEFDSLDVILREYARRGRIAISFVEPDAQGMFDEDALASAIAPGTDLVVVSQALFQTGQLLRSPERLVARAHDAGAKVLLDVYHALGVVPVDIEALGADFAVGGSYKYLRGGPGACFLYVAPRHLDARLATLDIGWFAKRDPFSYARPDPPLYAEGGDAWMESTPAVLPWYQARAGQVFTLALGVERIRGYSLTQQRTLVELLAARGIRALGGTAERGAFVAVRRDDSAALADALGGQGIDVDARGPWLRLCPDVLTTTAELQRAASALGALV
jgi:kynureninase